MVGSVRIPASVKHQAALGLLLKKNGFAGGTVTGFQRARQLRDRKAIDYKSLADMRAWFARHGPDARNGGTSYPGYRRWVQDQKPRSSVQKNEYRGAVAWLIWGGDAAYRWLKTKAIRNLLREHFPKRKTATLINNLA